MIVIISTNHCSMMHSYTTLRYLFLTSTIHTYCTYMHTYIHTYVHACMHTHIHTYVCAYVHTYIQAHKDSKLKAFQWRYVHTYVHTVCIHNIIITVYVYAYMCTYVQCMYVHVSIYPTVCMYSTDTLYLYNIHTYNWIGINIHKQFCTYVLGM